MALQHFYSRVPFRVSMFNKTDGFDTFACSEGLSEEFIAKELSAVCERKPNAREAVEIRKGALSPVFCSRVTKTGELVQSCTSYIPSDYTGERISYFVHSLVFDEKEKKTLLRDPDNAPLNPDMFEKDISVFNITSPNAAPVYDYPEKEISAVKAPDTESLIEKYGERMLKSFIFALFDTVCGKTGSIYFTLPEEDNHHAATDFFNAAVRVVPYHIRDGLSFVSGVSDTAALPGFKVKCLRGFDIETPPLKSIFLNFSANVVAGIKDAAYELRRKTVDFFFEMMKNDAVRREFLVFSSEAVEKLPAAGSLKAEKVESLVFLFRCGSGFYAEKDVLPDDEAIASFFAAYGSLRDALSDEYRINSVKCLRRYPEGHKEIPPKIFSKLCKLYPSEHICVKRIISEVVLDLIHTDLMRGKLFAFLKSNYDREDDLTKEVIAENLSRVFYGGFLQPQILSFFDSRFGTMTEKAKTAVLRKLLLALRSKHVQKGILTLMETRYDSLCEENKKMIYSAIPEHFVDGNGLARSLIEFADGHIENESAEIKTKFASALTAAVVAEQKKQNRRLLQIVCEKDGFCGKALFENVVTSMYRRKIFGEYLSLSCKYSFVGLAANIVEMFAGPREIPDESFKALMSGLSKNPAIEIPPDRFFELVGITKKAAGAVLSRPSPQKTAFASDFYDKVLAPAVCGALFGVFELHDVPNAVEKAVASLGDLPCIKDCGQITTLTDYIRLKDAAASGDVNLFFERINKFLENENIPAAFGEYMYEDLVKSGAVSSEPLRSVVCIYRKYIRGESASFARLYDAFIDSGTISAEETKSLGIRRMSVKKTAENRKLNALTAAVRTADILFSLGGDKMRDYIKSEKCDFSVFLRGRLNENRRAGIKGIKEMCESEEATSEEFKDYCGGIIEARKRRKPGILNVIRRS